jgi:hypothetical protein
MQSTSGPHQYLSIYFTAFKPGPAGHIPDRPLEEQLPMFSEVVNCFLLWNKGFDIFFLEFGDQFLQMTRDDFNDWYQRAMTKGAKWAIDH